MAYETTTVAVTRSQEQIRNMLRKTGADRIAFGEVLVGDDKGAALEFIHLGLKVRVLCPLKEPKPADISAKAQRSRSKSRDAIADELLEQEAKRVWRVIHWSLKARMEAVTEGLETFEQAFLPHLVDPRTGMTIWEMVQPSIDSGSMQLDGAGLNNGPLAIEAGSS